MLCSTINFYKAALFCRTVFLSNTTQIYSLVLLTKSRKNCVYNLNPSGACQSCFMKSGFLFQFVWNEFGQHCMVCVGVSGGHGQLQKLTSGGSGQVCLFDGKHIAHFSPFQQINPGGAIQTCLYVKSFKNIAFAACPAN